MQIEVGSIVEGKISGITNFGAFVELPNGKTGLVHISEVAGEYVKDLKEHLKDVTEVKVKVLSVDDTGKISLSIKQAQPPKVRPKSAPRADWSAPKSPAPLSFEDKLSKFKSDSDERMSDIRRNMDSKRRGGGGYRRSMNSY